MPLLPPCSSNVKLAASIAGNLSHSGNVAKIFVAHYYKTMSILTNHLLIASPELENDFFAQSVVLVLEHSETNGAAGIVLNKPSEVPLEKIWPELDEDEFVRANELVHIGGPCDGPVVALHSCPECSEVAVLPGVAMAVKSNNLHRLMAQDHASTRVFSGYAGWAPGQLETEIRAGGWYATEASPSLIFGDQTDLWRRACEQYGNEIISSAVGQRIPSDPLVN